METDGSVRHNRHSLRWVLTGSDPLPKIPSGTVRTAVVVGCDGKPDSDSALRFAVQEAELRSAPLVLVTAFFRPVDPDIDDFDTPDRELRAHARETAEAALARALDLSPGMLPPHETITQEGDAAKVLLGEDARAALLVIGTHQRHLLQRLLHGHSTSQELILHSHVPVVVVPPPSAFPVTRP